MGTAGDMEAEARLGGPVRWRANVGYTKPPELPAIDQRSRKRPLLGQRRTRRRAGTVGEMSASTSASEIGAPLGQKIATDAKEGVGGRQRRGCRSPPPSSLP